MHAFKELLENTIHSFPFLRFHNFFLPRYYLIFNCSLSAALNYNIQTRCNREIISNTVFFVSPSPRFYNNSEIFLYCKKVLPEVGIVKSSFCGKWAWFIWVSSVEARVLASLHLQCVSKQIDTLLSLFIIIFLTFCFFIKYSDGESC